MLDDRHLAPHWATAALVTIDMQRDYLSDAEFGVAGTTEIVPNLTALSRAFREAGRPIVHMLRLYPRDGRDVDRVRRTRVEGGADFVSPGTPGRLLVDGLIPTDAPDLNDELLLAGKPQPLGPGEYALYKPRWGAFYRTPLADLLAWHGVDTLVIAGCNLPNCTRASVVEAHERDFRVVLVPDAVSQTSELGLREVAGLGTILISTADVVTSINRA